MAGTVYGVILNDRDELATLDASFAAPPYSAPPQAPVLFIKPRNCVTVGGAPVPVPADADELEVAATVALLFDEHGPAAACLALEVSVPHRDYYRPAVRERCRDGFLPLARFGPVPARWEAIEIVTAIDGAEAHRWSLNRLARPVGALLRDAGSFMTPIPGDMLMVGLAGDAPRAQVGQTVRAECAGLPPLAVRLVAERDT